MNENISEKPEIVSSHQEAFRCLPEYLLRPVGAHLRGGAALHPGQVSGPYILILKGLLD